MDASTALPVVGMIGGGQLARMTHQASISLGQSLRVLAGSHDESAARVAHDVVLGDYTDYQDLAGFAAGCDVVTFDHEHVPTEHIRQLAAAGQVVYPTADALLYAQDKLAMRQRLSELDIPVPKWTEASAVVDAVLFGNSVGWPIMLKAARGGYDGKGVWTLDSPDAIEFPTVLGGRFLVEERVELRSEVAAVVARSPYGQAAAWPVVETVQNNGVCVEVLAPAPNLDNETAARAQELALQIADQLGVVGLLAVEMFDTPQGLLINELAMRPHNSGHWTIEGSRTSQFEQHLRAVLDYPLGATTLTAPAVVMANVFGGPEMSTVDGQTAESGKLMSLDERVHHCMARWPDVKIHLYGKESRPGRKLGHVTALGDDLTEVRRRANAAATFLREGESR